MTSDNFTFDVDNTSKSTNPPKVMYAGDIFSGQPNVAITDTGIFAAASKTQVLAITEAFGIHMTGDISLSAMPSQIYIGGGYWTLNPLLLSCLPSTSATPIPVLVKSKPLLLTKHKSLSDCLTFLGSNGL